MKSILSMTCAALTAVLVGACGRSEPEPAPAATESESVFSSVITIGSLVLDPDSVIIRSDGHPDAKIMAGGRLVIDGQDIPVTDAQRTHLIDYHAAGMLLRQHGKETGIAGAKVGAAAVGAIISGLMKGDPDSIGPKVEAKAEQVKQAALKLCEDIAAMRKAQDALVVDLEAFRPYARLDDSDVTGCRDGLATEPPSTEPTPEDAPASKEKPQFI